MPDEFVPVGLTTALECSEIKTPCGGCANQRGAAHQHFTDGVGAVAPGRQICNDVLVRQAALIDDLYHCGIIRFLPDSPKILT
jgi:hypothetical protein